MPSLPTIHLKLCALLALALVPLDASTSSELADDDASSRTTGTELESARLIGSARDEAVNDAVAQGLAWLVRGQAQNLDGSMAVGARDQTPVPIATTALGALALMAGGNSYDRGRYGTEVARAIDYLLAHCNLNPDDEAFGYIGRAGAPEAVRMHSHGFATLALAEAFSTSHKSASGKELKRSLEAAVHRIERSQGREGGWFYDPVRNTRHEGSVTICLVQALRAARDAGIRVDPGVVERAEQYVVKSQTENGLFAYEIYNPDAHTSVALTAAGVATLYSLGEYAGNVVERGMTAIWRELDLREAGEGKPPRFPYYERLYLSEAMWQHGELEHFERWSELEFPHILSTQKADGSWTDGRYGDSYATAINCLVLSMNQELLPIFQR